MQKSPSNVRRSGDYLEFWTFDCLHDDYGAKTHFVPQFGTCGDRVIIWNLGNLIACTMTMGSKQNFVPQIGESDPAQSVPLEASTRKERFGEKKLHQRRYSFCDKPLQTCGDRVIFSSFGNLIACTMTMGSKHTSFPKLKSQTPPKCDPGSVHSQGVF